MKNMRELGWIREEDVVPLSKELSMAGKSVDISLECAVAICELVTALDEAPSIPGAATKPLSVIRRSFGFPKETAQKETP